MGNPSTTIKYALTPSLSLGERVSEGRVRGLLITLKVYDILGREAATLVNKTQKPGNYEVTFDANSVNRRISSGVYFYRLQVYPSVGGTGTFEQNRKIG